MSESTTDMTGVMIDPVTGEIIDQKELAERLLAQAKEQEVSLVGPGGLLNQLTRNVLETALEAELTEHLGHEHGQTPIAANMRNGTRSKTVLTEIGPVEIEVPRDRDGSFEPVIVPKRKRRLDGIDQIVLSLSARGLTTGEIAAHFEEVYGAKVSKDTISRITEKVASELAEWSARPLDPIYPVLFVDAVVVKVRDGQVRNTPFYVVMGVTTSGEREILGIWAGDGGEGARFWLQVFSELKNRGVEDVLIAVCDGLKGLPEAITTTWERTVVQQCIVHLIRTAVGPVGDVVCFAPRCGNGAVGEGAALIAGNEGEALDRGEEAGLASQVQDLALGAQDCGDDVGVAGELAQGGGGHWTGEDKVPGPGMGACPVHGAGIPD
nr:hypothetical protein GCM10017547_10730 [Pseudarthrobacter oxydans]